MSELDYKDKTKYFIIPKEDRIFFEKGEERDYPFIGNNHKELAYRILAKTGLSSLYFSHEYGLSPQLFLTYCGYILVDNDTRNIDMETEIATDSSQNTEHTAIGYCSAAVNDETIELLKREFEHETCDFIDSNIKEAGTKQDRMIEIIEKSREIRAKREVANENIEDDLER